MTVEKSLRLLFRGVKIDAREEGYVIKKLQAVEKVIKKITRVEVEIGYDKKKNKFRVEVMIKTQHKLYRAEDTTESIEGSIDLVEESLKEQAKKDIGKNRTLKMRGRRSLKKKTVVDNDARVK
jgi:ribosomal subunit interface protein